MKSMNAEIKSDLPRLPANVNASRLDKLDVLAIPRRKDSTAAVKIDAHKAGDSSLGFSFITQNAVDAIGIIPPSTSIQNVEAVIDRVVDRQGRPNQPKQLLIASEVIADLLHRKLPDAAVLSPSQIHGLINDDAAHEKYGVRLPLPETAGTFGLGAMIVDRFVLTKMRDRAAAHNHVFSDLSAVDEPPTKHAELIVLRGTQGIDVPYVQKSEVDIDGFAPSSKEAQRILAETLVNGSLEPSNNVLARRQFFDNVPFSTGRYGQDLIAPIIAKEYAEAYGLRLGKIYEATGIDINVTTAEEAAQDYEQLLKIIGSELYAKGLRLIDAGPEQFHLLNEQLAKNPRLGQLLPSLHTLSRDGIINFDAVRLLEKKLHSKKFPAIPREITDFVPNHMVDADADDTPANVVSQLDEAIQGIRTQPETGAAHVKTDAIAAVDPNGNRIREGDSQAIDEKVKKLDPLYQGMYLFNREKKHIEDVDGLLETARRFIRDEEIPIILPAYKEPKGWDVARAASLLSPGRVIFVSPDANTLSAAAPFSHAIDQNEVLKYIDIAKLKELGFIPTGREVPLRGKGMTILLGLMWGIANGYVEPKNQYLAHVDTDVINMDPASVYYHERGGNVSKRRPYRPLEYMAAALSQMPSSHHAVAVQPAKVGPPRKGEVKHPTFAEFANSDDPFLRKVGLGLGRVVWPSPGEAIVDGRLYMEGPWQVTTGFDLDRYFKAVLWELRQEEQTGKPTRDVFAQVVVPPDKIENGGVAEKNDWAEVNWATHVFSNALNFYRELAHDAQGRQDIQPLVQSLSEEQRGLLPKKIIQGLEPALVPTFDLDHIKAFNEKFAGKQVRVLASESPEPYRDEQGGIIYPADEVYNQASGPNFASYRWNPFYLPPVTWMIENGIVDLDGIKANVRPYSSTGRITTF